MTRSVYLGTPVASVPALRALHDLTDIQLVVTRPDRPRGRGRRLAPSPVKVAADELGLKSAQPERPVDLAAAVAGAGAIDVGVVVAFGMILRPEVLARPRRGFLNVHFSLLPRWRGAAPVERAIMEGDAVTGVTIMEVDEGLDTGGIVTRREMSIPPTVTAGEMTVRLAAAGAALLADVLPAWLEGDIRAVAQPAGSATYAHKIEAGDRRLSPQMTRTEFANTVRALAPEPGAQLAIDGVIHKILAIEAVDAAPPPGRWLEADGRPVLGVADGGVALSRIQPPGKQPMDGKAWLRGHQLPSA
jgi:methionyl-tRNA formyltransferase